MNKKFLVDAFSVMFIGFNVDASVQKLAQVTTVSHGGFFHELSNINTSNSSFTSVETTSSDTSSLHSPEGVSLYPFSPMPSAQDVRPLKMYKEQAVPRYLQYIGECQKTIQSDDESWRGIARARKSGNF